MVREETRARALALQLLYAREVGGSPAGTRETAWAGLLQLTPAGPRLQQRALEIAESVLARGDELDGHIQAAAEHWRLERLAVVDRIILRLSIRELLAGHTPPRVVIDEAVRLARWFGGVKSPAFVNGVLDRAAREFGRL